MLLTFSQGYPKYLRLISSDPQVFHYIGGADSDALKELSEWDENSVIIYGTHLIDNYKELRANES